MGRVCVVGLGPGGPASLPQEGWQALRRARQVFLRTARHPIVTELERGGITFATFDHLYEEAPSFEAVYAAIADAVLQAARAGGASGYVAYGVPGHPLVGEASVREIMSRAREQGVQVEMVIAPSFLDPLFAALGLDPVEGLQVLDASDLSARSPSPLFHVVVMQVYDRHVASGLKLDLMRVYPDDHPVTVVHAAGVPGMERIVRVPLFELDRQGWFDHLTTVYVPPCQKARAANAAFADLVRVVERLRAPGGCPWDREQTHRSLRPYVLEEAYEVVEAIDGGDPRSLKEELGDLLLQVVLHSVIAAEGGDFDIAGVVEGITAKIIRRHPHVFGTGRAETAEEVRSNWEDLKHREKGDGGERSVLDGVHSGLPSLMEAEELQARAAAVGFDWRSPTEVWPKLEEELGELRQVLAAGGASAEEELGDVFFALVNLARLLGINAEVAVKAANRKFSRRFRAMEARAREEGRRLADMPLADLDALWEAVKGVERAKKL